MVKKVSLFRMAFKNFTGTNVNVKARKAAKKKAKRRKSKMEKAAVKRGAVRLKKAGYTGKKLKDIHRKVISESREDKIREAVTKHVLKKKK